VTRDEILQFVHRDWSALATSKTSFWRGMKSARSAAEVLALSDRLRQQARQLRPAWPDLDERLADLAVHERVAEALRAVARRSR
jgi:hypothetical protein